MALNDKSAYDIAVDNLFEQYGKDKDPINPSHYKSGTIEVIDIIEQFDLGPHEANIIKYVLRYKKKNGVEDLKKAQWYLNRLIEKLK